MSKIGENLVDLPPEISRKLEKDPLRVCWKNNIFFCIFQKVKGSASNIYKLSFLNNPRIQKQTQWYLLLSNSSLHLSNTPCSSGCQMQRVVARTAGGVFFKVGIYVETWEKERYHWVSSYHRVSVYEGYLKKRGRPLKQLIMKIVIICLNDKT